jgi:hypothetical protein
MDANDLSILNALARDSGGVRGLLGDADQAELDRLLGMFADAVDEQAADAIGEAVALHLNTRLPPAEQDRLRLSPGTTEPDRTGLRELAVRFHYRGALTAVAPGRAQDVAGTPASVAARSPWDRIRARLLSEASLSQEQVEVDLRQDPWQRNLVRLTDEAGDVRLPTFQFGTDGAPLPLVLSINEVLRADRDPWGVADWWLGPNHWLDTPPARALGRVPDDELMAVAVAVGEGY